jgi:molecular chaperone GrpE (heat shock protein)
MNPNIINKISSNQKLKLPEPDFDNITVLTSQLPNKPILPWNQFDSPVFHQKDVKNSTKQEEQITAKVQETDKEIKEISEDPFSLRTRRDMLQKEMENLLAEIKKSNQETILKRAELPQNTDDFKRLIDALKKDTDQLPTQIKIMINRIEQLLR